jgi:hypothetical protein
MASIASGKKGIDEKVARLLSTGTAALGSTLCQG